MNKAKIAIASDHAAFEEKAQLISYIKEIGFDVIDFGTNSKDSCHYPEFVFALVKSIQSNQCQRGILLCGSGIGVSMVANRFQNIRAALCRTNEEAKLTRNHNDANVLCLGARGSSLKILKEVSLSFLINEFENGRHQDRLDLFNGLGEKNVPQK